MFSLRRAALACVLSSGWLAGCAAGGAPQPCAGPPDPVRRAAAERLVGELVLRLEGPQALAGMAGSHVLHEAEACGAQVRLTYLPRAAGQGTATSGLAGAVLTYVAVPETGQVTWVFGGG